MNPTKWRTQISKNEPSILRLRTRVSTSTTLLTDCHSSKTLHSHKTHTHTHTHTHSHTVCPRLLGPQADPWVLPSRWCKVSDLQQPCRGPSPGKPPPPSSVSHGQSPPPSSTCPRRSPYPWPSRGWTGRTPPLRSSSRHT